MPHLTIKPIIKNWKNMAQLWFYLEEDVHQKSATEVKRGLVTQLTSSKL